MRRWKKVGLVLLGAVTAMLVAVAWFQKRAERNEQGGPDRTL